MKIKAYHWTNLSEALRFVERKYPKRYSYWITDVREAMPYAEVKKWDDRDEKWAILEAIINIPNWHKTYIQPTDWSAFEKNKWQILQNKTGIYQTEKFQVLILPPAELSNITDPKIVTIV